MKVRASALRPSSGKPSHAGLLLHSPMAYDVLVRIFLFGRERSFRERLLVPAALRAGERVLDIGCGTGSLAIAAARQVGSSGAVFGIDASSQMIDGARRKAARQGANVDFYVAPAQALPFPAETFDVLLSSLMLHHLTRGARRELALEARRVLKPDGRLLVIDFEKKAAKRSWWQTVLRHRHGSIDPREMTGHLEEAGFRIITQGSLGVKGLVFALSALSTQSTRESRFAATAVTAPASSAP